MTAYVIAEVEVNDPEAYKLYADKAPGVTLPAGGKYLARAGTVECLEGEPPKSRIVVIEFADMEAARAFYYGKAYQEIIPLRQAASAWANKGKSLRDCVRCSWSSSHWASAGSVAMPAVSMAASSPSE